jgi:hypothetical protein
MSHPTQTQVQTPTHEIERIERSLKAKLEGLAHRVYATERSVVIEYVKDILSEVFNVARENVLVIILLKSRPSKEFEHVLVYDEHGEIIEALGTLHIYSEVITGSNVYKVRGEMSAHFIKIRDAYIIVKISPPIEIEVHSS